MFRNYLTKELIKSEPMLRLHSACRELALSGATCACLESLLLTALPHLHTPPGLGAATVLLRCTACLADPAARLRDGAALLEALLEQVQAHTAPDEVWQHGWGSSGKNGMLIMTSLEQRK